MDESRLEVQTLVLQFCDNDFGDNTAAIGEDSVLFDQTIRPYRTLEGTEIRIRSWLFIGALRWSATFRASINVIEGFLFTRYGYQFGRLSAQAAQKAQKDSIAITRTLLRELRHMAPKERTAYAFNCGKRNADFVSVAQEAGFVPLIGSREFVEDGPGGAAAVLARDGAHLNEEGNSRLARFLYQQICPKEHCRL